MKSLPAHSFKFRYNIYIQKLHLSVDLCTVCHGLFTLILVSSVGYAVCCECGYSWTALILLFGQSGVVSIGIKHGLSCINIRDVPRERRPRFSIPPKEPGEC